ncbi:hypothetical protein [uncultured Erythrobacter sp.]|uniref:hypothetical protein n=1 Tax=uncultured Erythrobacter sp. TaxID=263913 RepID=UPI00262C70B7|nr:hypothetical protein [uncultured Erythrobacter sp.]
MARSVAIIGAGQIGYAAGYEFAFHDWDVSICSRSKPAWQLRPGERFIEYTTGQDRAPKADLVIDTIAFDEDDIVRYDPDAVGRLITISSASVYCDDQGRTLDEAAVNGFPEFDAPVDEEQSTVPPGPQTYSTRKVRMENRALDLFGDRATVIRPCAIYGPHGKHPREWWFVKRILDGRTKIPLAFAGRSQFDTTDTQDIAKFCIEADNFAWGGVYNLASDAHESVAQIGREIAELCEAQVELKLFEGAPIGSVGRTPWSVPRSFRISSNKSCALENGQGDASGFGARYGGHSLSAQIKWFRRNPPADWRAAFPQLAAYPWDLFDYAAEDRFLSSL